MKKHHDQHHALVLPFPSATANSWTHRGHASFSLDGCSWCGCPVAPLVNTPQKSVINLSLMSSRALRPRTSMYSCPSKRMVMLMIDCRVCSTASAIGRASAIRFAFRRSSRPSSRFCFKIGLTKRRASSKPRPAWSITPKDILTIQECLECHQVIINECLHQRLVSGQTITFIRFVVLNIRLVVLNWCLNIGLLLNLCLNKLFGATYPPVCSTVSLEGSVCFCAMGASERNQRVNRTSIKTRMLETQNAVFHQASPRKVKHVFHVGLCWTITINNLHPKIKLKEAWSGGGCGDGKSPLNLFK